MAMYSTDLVRRSKKLIVLNSDKGSLLKRSIVKLNSVTKDVNRGFNVVMLLEVIAGFFRAEGWVALGWVERWRFCLGGGGALTFGRI